MKKAIILAAGAGKRLGDLTKDIPKCLLPTDVYGSTLIDFSLSALKSYSISEIIIVSGYKESRLRQHIEKKWSSKLLFKFIFNDKFNDYNNIYSAYLAKDFWDDEVVLLNSDIIFDPDILRNLKQRANNPEAGVRASYLVIDDTKKLLQEDMKVEIDDYGQLKKINKNLNIERSHGEYIGITYLRGLDRVKFLESLEDNVKNKQLDLYYEDALDQILNETSILPCSTQGLHWTEVDTKEDYEVAKNIVKELKGVAIK